MRTGPGTEDHGRGRGDEKRRETGHGDASNAGANANGEGELTAPRGLTPPIAGQRGSPPIFGGATQPGDGASGHVAARGEARATRVRGRRLVDGVATLRGVLSLKPETEVLHKSFVGDASREQSNTEHGGNFILQRVPTARALKYYFYNRLSARAASVCRVPSCNSNHGLEAVGGEP